MSAQDIAIQDFLIHATQASGDKTNGRTASRASEHFRDTCSRFKTGERWRFLKEKRHLRVAVSGHSNSENAVAPESPR
jgi:hypothetical protein